MSINSQKIVFNFFFSRLGCRGECWIIDNRPSTHGERSQREKFKCSMCRKKHKLYKQDTEWASRKDYSSAARLIHWILKHRKKKKKRRGKYIYIFYEWKTITQKRVDQRGALTFFTASPVEPVPEHDRRRRTIDMWRRARKEKNDRICIPLSFQS